MDSTATADALREAAPIEAAAGDATADAGKADAVPDAPPAEAAAGDAEADASDGGASDAPAEAASDGSGSGDAASVDAGCLPSPSGLVGWWPGEGNGNDVIGGINASPVGTVGFAPGKIGQAFSFSGSSYEQAPFTQSGAMTIDAWAQAASVNQVLFTSILSSGLPAHYDPFFQIESNGTGQWAMDVGTGADEITPVLGSVATTFQHVAMTFDGTSGVAVYLDGVQAATATWTGTSPIAFEVLKIGANRDQNELFDGLVDEVHVFNRALTAAEVLAIRNAPLGICPPSAADGGAPGDAGGD